MFCRKSCVYTAWFTDVWLSKIWENICTITFAAAIKAISFIKNNALSDRRFRQHCEESEADFECPVMHAEKRWISKGKDLRFFALWVSNVSLVSARQLVEHIYYHIHTNALIISFII
jgi:hypothetical protein